MHRLDAGDAHSASWTILGGPSPGTVAALAIGQGNDDTLFAGTRVGVYRASEVDGGGQTNWQRLPSAPLEVITLGLSPQYAIDSTLFAGTGQGLCVSRNGGEDWRIASTPMANSVILCLAFSPNYATDGIILAGTLEDGIYYSDSRGERWSYRGFGLLDAAVYALAISPDFAHDETLFAGTESALYYSYNGARAWKLLDFPEEAAPILSLALSPHFAQDQTLYVGTEQQGLYCSTNLGKSWQKIDLPATSVNALVSSSVDGRLLAATNVGLFCSEDGGKHWICLLDFPDILSVVVKEDLLIAGLVNQGAWLTRDRLNWQDCFSPPARSLTGMVLSPHFDRDPVGFLYGLHEGIWRTLDGGYTWSCINEGLPSLDIRSLAVSPHFRQDRVVVAATAEGLCISEDLGEQWSVLTEMPAAHVAFAPNGRGVVVASLSGEILIAKTVKGSWQRLPLPWGKQSQVLTVTVDANAILRVAVLEQAEEVVSIWEGQPGRLIRILGQPAHTAPIVRFWVPTTDATDGVWYASLDHQVWEFRRTPEGRVAHLLFEVADGSKILTLTGSQIPNGSVLFALTSQTMYRATAGKTWTSVHNFGDERAVALVLSPAYADRATAFVLLLGGSFCCDVL